MATIKELNGQHLWNCASRDFRFDPHSTLPNGEIAAWKSLLLDAQPSSVKLLWPDHNIREAEIAKAHDLFVMFRAPGEGSVHFEDVLLMIMALTPAGEQRLVDVIEVGNEPDDQNIDALWTHAQYLEWVHLHCAKIALERGIRLATPGWRNGLRLPSPTDLFPLVRAQKPHLSTHAANVEATSLSSRLRQVYGMYRDHCLHFYDVHRLVASWRLNNEQRPANFPNDAIDMAQAWYSDLEALPNVPSVDTGRRRYYITEYGIAARLLAGYTEQTRLESDMEKAGRYLQFLRWLSHSCPFVLRAYAFIYFGNEGGFQRFSHTPGVYDANGTSSYYLDPHAWGVLGDAVART